MSRSFTDIFIRRPILSSVVSLLIFVGGIAAIFMLQLRQYPMITSTTLNITTAYPGASANIVQGFLTTPIEQAVGTVNGIDSMTSSSTDGVSAITVNLKLNYNPETAMTDISQAISSISSRLPRSAESPSIQKQDSNDFPSLILGFRSKSMNPEQISAYLNNTFAPKLYALGGISNVEVMGNMPFAMRIWLNPQKMAQLNVSAKEVANALAANSLISSAGQLRTKYGYINVDAKTNLTSADTYRQLVVKQTKNSIVRLQDVATVQLSSQYYKEARILFNGKDGVFIGIIVQPNANPLTVISKVRAQLPAYRASLPHGLTLSTVYNANDYIKASIHDVLMTIFEAALIVFAVMVLFLGSFRAVLIPLITMPVALIGTFFLMKLMGFSINLLTLLSLVLAIGLVVDDGIVVLENIYRHIEEGLSPFKAAIIGAREIQMPVVIMTLTLAAVYAPIGFMGGLSGALFTEFAYTLAASVILSGIIALTLSPMMTSRIITPAVLHSKLVMKIDALFEKTATLYARLLATTLSVRSAVLLFAGIVLVSCYFLYTGTKTELAPPEDQGIIITIGQGTSNANLDYLNTYMPPVLKLPEKFKSVTKSQFLIAGFPSSNSLFGGLILKTWDKRSETAMEIQPKVQAALNNIAGLQVFTASPPVLPGVPYGPPIQFVLKSTDNYSFVYDAMQNLVQKAQDSGLFIYVNNSLKFDYPELQININRQKAADLGINMSDISDILNSALSGNYVNYFTMEGYSYQVIPQLSDAYRMNMHDIDKLYVKTRSGASVPLSSLVEMHYTTQPSALTRFQQLNSATLSAVPKPGVSVGQAYTFLKQAANTLPSSIETDTSGALRQFIQEGNALVYAFLFALLIIFLMLAAQFESFRDPFIILITVPLSICGALIPLYIGSMFNIGFCTINIYSQIGLVTLIGLISKHGILMTEFANKLQETGLSKLESIQRSARIRLRPILMTTAAMVFGVLPLILASGAGAEARHSIAIVIFFGMAIGTLFTLFVLPTIYTYLAKDRQALVNQWATEDKLIDELDHM